MMKAAQHIVREKFKHELSISVRQRYGKIPSYEQFSRDMFISCGTGKKISRETVRKWFTGATFPDLLNLIHLKDWLNLNVTEIFAATDNSIEIKEKKEKKEKKHIELIENSQINQYKLLDCLTETIEKRVDRKNNKYKILITIEIIE